VICDMQGVILYASSDVSSRVRRPILGENLCSFLDPSDAVRFQSFPASGEERLVCRVRGIRGFHAVCIERRQQGKYPTYQCTLATKENDLAAVERTVRPRFFEVARRELNAARARSGASDPQRRDRLDGCIEAMYQSSMLLLVSTEMLFSEQGEKYMSNVTEYLREITACAERSVRRLDLSVRLETEGVVEACYDLPSFTLMYLTMLAVLNDVSSTHSARLSVTAVEDGAYLSLETTGSMRNVPSFSRCPINEAIRVLPESVQFRLHVCELIGNAYGYEVTCTCEDGRFSFSVDLPHVRRGNLYLKADPFRQQDPAALCESYLRYLSPGPR